MGTRAAALKRWRKPGERRRMSQVMRLRFRPKLGPHPHGPLPSSVSALLELLTDSVIEVVECAPLHTRQGVCWQVIVIDGTTTGLAARFTEFVHAAGLELYDLYSRPLPYGEGYSVGLVVGTPEGDD